MSIATAIQNAQQKVANAYTAVNAKGGTLPATQDLSNLPTAIDSISGGIDTVEATNYTESAISTGDKVWINKEENRLYNFTTIGSPTIDVQTYNVSNFNTTSYITLDKILSFESIDSWEDVVCFTTGSDVSTTQCVYCSNVNYWGLGVEIKNNKLNIGASSKGSSFDIFLTETSAPYTINANTKYYIKVSYTNGLYTISIAESDGIYTVLTTISSSLQPLVGIRRYGVNDSASYPFYGVLNLSESYIKINNEYYWKPLITEPDSYIIQDYNIIQQNVTPFGSAQVKDGIVYNLTSSSGATSTTNNFAVTSSTPWEYVVCCKSNGDFGSNYGNYISACGGYIQGPYINIEENGNILTQFTNGSSWLGSLIAYSGNARTLNQKIWIKTTYDGNGNYASYSSLDGENWTAGESASYSGINITRPLQFGYSSSGTYFRGIIYLDECYIKINGVETWRGYVKTDKINAPEDTLTGTAAENIAISGTGDVEIGNVIEPTLGTKTITVNGTYNASSDNLDGFSSVTVDVASAPTKKYNLLDRVKDDSNNEIGTVSGFFTDANNVEYAVVCLDAQYRLASGKVFNATGNPTNLPMYSDNYDVLGAKETATFNTQKILDWCSSMSYTSTACNHCRSKSFMIDGANYYGQLPNFEELIGIAEKYQEIEIVDTSASTYTSLNFSVKRQIVGSSQYDFSSFWSINSSDFVNGSAANKFVVPVLEIPNT